MKYLEIGSHMIHYESMIQLTVKTEPTSLTAILNNGMNPMYDHREQPSNKLHRDILQKTMVKRAATTSTCIKH